MANVRCIETKGYNLTVDKEYEIQRDDREYFFVENDNGKVARYVKSLFREVRATPVRTQRSMIESISWNAQDRRVSFTDIQGNVRTVQSALSFSNSSISCGIHQCSGIDTLIGAIARAVNQLDGDDDYMDLRKAILTRILTEEIKNKTNVSMITMSTTTANEDMIAVIDTVADMTSAVRRNPNSSNLIKMWVFYTAANPN